jgi:hypothetical protein
MYNTTIRNSYKDDKSGEWKRDCQLQPHGPGWLGQLSAQAFQANGELKSQSRGR